MKREAVLACLTTAKSFHRQPWAKTGIELLVEHVQQNKSRSADRYKRIGNTNNT
jgi:hypothetical protein